MLPVLFKVGSIEIHSFGLFFALGFLVGILLLVYYGKKEGIDPQASLDLSLYIIIASIIGPRLFYVIGEWNYFINNPLEIIMVQRGGMVFIGGLLFSVAATILFARKRGLSIYKVLDALSPGVALAYAIGRIGCFLNGCCFGLPTTLPWGIKFPLGSLASLYCPEEHLHPTQLYSFSAMFLVFLFLAWLYQRKKFDGQIMAWWMILYSAYRFIVEFFRFSPIHWLGLTPTQWLILPLFVLGIWIIKKQNT